MTDAQPDWYKDAIIYELHVRAFFDTNDDGVGDFEGLIQKLDYLQDLGVTCLWLLPFYPSPLRDDGYDIADYRAVHEKYGTIDQFRRFVDEAHARGLRVITELVINHTSDQHPWFQAARHAPPGSPEREFYVWSDTPRKYEDARIIFTDTEKSNWTFDDVAGAYYWHRFFSHQPDLNFDNPAVFEAVAEVMRFWLDIGVDGLRLDAIPYLIEREGTNCENLPESHQIIKRLRRLMDETYPDRMLLAEANQWPADVLPYFGDGDECHMAFHFPLMPRIFMALRQEDRHPIVEILRQTPPIPPECQWAIFLRNHDELTLEMVTDEERDYMYREYAADPRMRINLGIRRRLAPLADNSRRRIELLNSLLFSMPGTPVMYYGDEIGMGDNVYLGDRNGVRTPMQWSSDRNAGFSRADFAALYAPPVMDSVYGFQAINVEAQQRAPWSLLNWMKRVIALRKRFKAFGRGTIRFLRPSNRKVLAYLRSHEDELVLCVANMSRSIQPVELDLSAFEGYTPTEVFGRETFPTIGSSPYFLTLGSHSFYWFRLEKAPQAASTPSDTPGAEAPRPLPALTFAGSWDTLMEGKHRILLERGVLGSYIASQRWFGSKSSTIETVSIRDWQLVAREPAPSYLTRVEVFTADGQETTYMVPLALVPGEAGEALAKEHPWSVLATVKGRKGQALLVDATAIDQFCHALLDLIGRTDELTTQTGRVVGVATSVYPEVRGDGSVETVKRGSVEQSNTTLVFGGRLLLKLFRRLQGGINPDFEIGRFLTENAHFDRVPKTAGAIEFRKVRSEPTTLAILQEMVRNQGQGWEWVLGVLGRYFDEVEGQSHRLERMPTPPQGGPLALSAQDPPDVVFEVVGTSLHSMGVLGRRTAEMHLALASDPSTPEFAPEPLLPEELTALGGRVRQLANDAFAALKRQRGSFDEASQALVDRVLKAGPELVAKVVEAARVDVPLVKIRSHGDYHLGQVLWQENDFILLDFEGEPGRTLAERRAKTSVLKDVAGMLRSFDYAASSALMAEVHERPELRERLEPWARLWSDWTSATFLRAYRLTVAGAALLPDDSSVTARVLDLFMLEKLVWELRYELNYRPDWAWIPLLGLLRLLNPEGDAGALFD